MFIVECGVSTPESWMSTWIAVAAVAVGGMGCFGCNGKERGEGSMSQDADERSVSEVYALVDTMPDWTSMDPNDAVAVAQIETAAKRIAAYDTKVIRAALARYDAEARAQAASRGKLFSLSRILFDVPQAVRRDSPHFRFFGGRWLGLPISGDPCGPRPSDQMDMRWPWSVDKDGNWRLTGRFQGFLGPPYDAMKAFDYYNEHFGRRKV